MLFKFPAGCLHQNKIPRGSAALAVAEKGQKNLTTEKLDVLLFLGFLLCIHTEIPSGLWHYVASL